MKNIGTLVGATVRINDSDDQYPVALQVEIKGGHHTKGTIAKRDAIPVHLREAGMTCYVAEDGNTYELGNDLVTWSLKSSSTANGGGGTTQPGTGGDSTTTTIISGNFGEWKDLPGKSGSVFDEQLKIRYKADISAFPSRAIVYLTGQFGLNASFVGTEITLGTLPANTRPKAKLKKYFITKNVELFLVVETTGAVKLVSKDGFNLPVAEGPTEDQPYYLDTFWHPDIAIVEPITYTATRTADFTRNNCGSGSAGSVVSFNKTYTSKVSQADADNQAANDPDFATEGQNYANANGVCSMVYTSVRSDYFIKTDCQDGYDGSEVLYEKTYTSTISQADADSKAENDPDFNSEGYENAKMFGTCIRQIVKLNFEGDSVDYGSVAIRDNNFVYTHLNWTNLPSTSREFPSPYIELTFIKSTEKMVLVEIYDKDNSMIHSFDLSTDSATPYVNLGAGEYTYKVYVLQN